MGSIGIHNQFLNDEWNKWINHNELNGIKITIHPPGWNLPYYNEMRFLNNYKAMLVSKYYLFIFTGNTKLLNENDNRCKSYAHIYCQQYGNSILAMDYISSDNNLSFLYHWTL